MVLLRRGACKSLASRPTLAGKTELVLEVIPQVLAVVDDVRLIDRQYRITGNEGLCREIAVRIHGNQFRGGHHLPPSNLNGIVQTGWLRSPLRQPEAVAL